MSDTSNPPVGVRSEVGRLRTVMLHRPGNELRRLTPRNNDALLFDGLPWVDRAQQEHDAFADALRGRGVEVLYLSTLLTRRWTTGGPRPGDRADPHRHPAGRHAAALPVGPFCPIWGRTIWPRS